MSLKHEKKKALLKNDNKKEMIETNDLPVKGDIAFILFRKNVIKNHVTSVDDLLEMHGAKRRRWERVKDNDKEGFSLNTAISERERKTVLDL